MPPLRRALLFAPYFLPRRRVGSMRPFRFAIHLREFGWEPVVLTIATRGQHLSEKEARLLEGIEIIELSSPFDRTTKSESQLGLAPKTSTKIDGVLRKLDRQFPIDTWLLLFLARYREMLRIVRKIRPEVIWTTGDPWSGLVFSGRLAARTGIPWVADFRDPWTLSPHRSKKDRRIAAAIEHRSERRVLGSADIVIFQTRSVEAAYRNHYSDLSFESRTIPNSFDPVVFDDAVDLDGAASTAVSEGDGLEVGFFGRFREMSPATIVVDVLSEVRHREPNLASRIKIISFGPLNSADSEYARRHGVRDCFQQQDVVPLEKALSVLRRFDLLLLSTDLRRESIIPAKLFEYLPSGRPILSLSRNLEVGEILRQTGTGIQINPHDPAAVAEILIDCLRAKSSDKLLPVPFAPQKEEIDRFDARRATGELADVFNLLSNALRDPTRRAQ